MKKALAACELNALPVMPATAEALLGELGKANSNNSTLQTITLRDPGAAVALYRLVDKVRPGAAEDMSDPAHAVSMVGLQAFEATLKQLPAIQPPTIKTLESQANASAGLPSRQFAYSHAAHAAFFARALSEYLQLGNPNEIAVAALLQNPATLALWHKDEEAATRASNAMRDGVPFDLAFSAEMGEPLKHANKRLAEAWHLPRLAYSAMGDWDPFNRQLQVVALADMLAQTSMAGWPEESETLHCEILEEFLGKPKHEVAAWWHQQAVAAARELGDSGYPLAAVELLQLPSGEEEVEIPPLPSRKPKPEAHTKPAKQSLQEVIANLMRRVQQEAGVERAVFGMLNQERTQVKARLALGGEKTDPMRRFAVNLKEKSLFSALLGKQQSIWLNPGNRLKYASMLKHLPLDERGEAGFYAMSIFVQKKPLGLLYADGGDLNEDNYRRFRKLCQEFAQVLSKPAIAA